MAPIDLNMLKGLKHVQNDQNSAQIYQKWGKNMFIIGLEMARNRAQTGLTKLANVQNRALIGRNSKK